MGSNEEVNLGRVPCAFLPHGGGPLPLLGEKDHQNLVTFMTSFVSKYLSAYKPTSCLVISAHWEESTATVQTGDTTSLYYDYYGFPEETYNLDYQIKPADKLAVRVCELLGKHNIPTKKNSKRGYDHGVFIPMKLMYPNAEIPMIQLSLVSGLDPQLHIKIGEALAPLRDEGVFIFGSGMSYHNMRGFGKSSSDSDSEVFHKYLREVLTKEKSYEEKVKGLVEWSKAPKARECHPKEEHLIPLMSCFGTSSNQGGKAEEIFFDGVGGVKCAGYLFS